MILIILIAFIFLLLFHVFGKVIITLLNIEDARYPFVYGFIFYIGIFYIFTAPQVFLHVSWMFYFWSMVFVNCLLLFMACYAVIKNRIKLFSRDIIFSQKLFNFIPVIIVVSAFLVIWFFSTGTYFFRVEFAPASSDNFVYLARAIKSIGTDAIFNFPTGVTTVGGQRDVLLYVSYWELLWGFFSEVLPITLLEFVHIVLPLILYPIIVCAIDEFLHKLFPDRVTKSRKYAIFVMLLLVIINGLQLEFVKFLFYPWYGNVFSTMLYIPYFTILASAVLKGNKKMYIPLLLFPFVATGFTAVTLVYTAFAYAVFAYVYWRSHEKNSLQKLFFFSLILISIIFGSVAIIDSVTRDGFSIATIFKFSEHTALAEKEFFRISRGYYLFFIATAMIFLLNNSFRRKENYFEKALIGGSLFFIVLSSLPFFGNMIFNLFGFPYRRLLESLMFFIMMYSGLCLVLMKNQKLKHVCIYCMAALAILVNTHGLFLEIWRPFFGKNPLENTSRVATVSLHLAEEIAKDNQKKGVCFIPNKTIETKNRDIYVDFSMALMGTDKNAFLSDCMNDKDINLEKTDYIVTGSSEEAEKLMSMNLELVYEEHTELISVYLFQNI